MRFRIVKGTKVLATKSVKLTKKQANVVIRPKRKLKKGRYTLGSRSPKPGERSRCRGDPPE